MRSARNAVILHGTCDEEEYYSDDYPSLSNSHWLPWIQKQLLIKGVAAATPEIPEAWHPDYANWRREFERHDITPETTLIGHSCGGGFLVRWLSEHENVQVGDVVLVAPWLDPERGKTDDFFDFEIDPRLTDRTASITVFASDDDDQDIQKSVSIIRGEVANLTYREFHGYGHFCYSDMGTRAFPELLEAVVHPDRGR